MFEQEEEGDERRGRRQNFNRTGKNNEKTNQRKFKSEKIYLRIKASKDEKVVGDKYGDGILGHQFNKSLESFAPCYSQALLQAGFQENQTLLWCL